MRECVYYFKDSHTINVYIIELTDKLYVISIGRPFLVLVMIIILYYDNYTLLY